MKVIIQWFAAVLFFVAINLIAGGIILLFGKIILFFIPDANEYLAFWNIIGILGLVACLAFAVYAFKFIDLITKRRL